MQLLYEPNDVLKSYDRRIKIRKNGTVEIRLYDSPIIYNDENYEKYDEEYFSTMATHGYKKKDKCITDLDSKKCISKSVVKEMRSDNLSRTRNSIIDYASENADKFHSFVTLTFGDEVTDITYANKRFSYWIDKVRRYCKNKGAEFYYLGVPEFQKNGRVHYHVFTSLKCGSDIIKKETLKLWNSSLRKYKKIDYYDLLYWNDGFSSAFDIDNETDSDFNIALYMCKYLYKDLDNRLFGHTKILKSNNLVKPNVYKLEKDNVVWQTAWYYIYNLLNKKENEIQSINVVEPTSDKPYLKSQKIINLNLQLEDNILKEILQDNLDF